MTRGRRALRAFAILVLTSGIPLVTAAQPVVADEAPDRVTLLLGECLEGALDVSALRSALAVELVGLDMRLGDDDGESSVPEMVLELACVPDENALLIVRCRRAGARVERVADLSDMAPALRARTLALAAHDALLELSEARRAAEAGATGTGAGTDSGTAAPTDAATAAPTDSATTTIGPAPTERAIGDEPSAATEHAAATAIPRAAAIEASPIAIAVRGRVFVLEGPTVAGGPLAAVEITLTGLPLALVAGASFTYASATDVLGDLRGSALDGLIGARGFVDIDALRISASALLALGWWRIEGVADRDGITHDVRDVLGVAIDVGLGVSYALSTDVAIALSIGVRGVLEGLEGRAADRRSLAFTGALPYADLGLVLSL